MKTVQAYRRPPFIWQHIDGGKDVFPEQEPVFVSEPVAAEAKQGATCHLLSCQKDKVFPDHKRGNDLVGNISHAPTQGVFGLGISFSSILQLLFIGFDCFDELSCNGILHFLLQRFGCSSASFSCPGSMAGNFLRQRESLFSLDRPSVKKRQERPIFVGASGKQFCARR